MLSGLPTDQPEVIALRVIGGLDVGHVAAITGKRPGTLRVLAHLQRHGAALVFRPREMPAALPGSAGGGFQ